MKKVLLHLAENGSLPDPLIRLGIQYLLQTRLEELALDDCERRTELQHDFLTNMHRFRIAEVPDKANEQHYELPAAFFQKVLGPNLKYSCALWPEGVSTLEQAEAEALKTTCRHADLVDGHHILELGCGWGSLTLWRAKNYQNSTIHAVSNSNPQRRFIEEQLQRSGHKNVSISTIDMNGFETSARYDRIVSVEMFEYMRNWPELFRRVGIWLKPDGRFFMHVFCHRTTPYAFEEVNEEDWITVYFFSGGIMPSDRLPYQVPETLKVERHFRWPGKHYQRTALAWLRRMDKHKASIWPVFQEIYGVESQLWWQRWRIFFLAVAELFGYRNGQEWWVSPYLLSKQEITRSSLVQA